MEEVKERRFSRLFKGSLVSLVITLVLILVFALILKFVELNDGIIMPVNQVIKVISILFGVRVMLKNSKEKGLIKGVILGLIYTIFSYLVFAVISRSFVFDLSVISDLLFGSIMGGICGAIFVNTKR